MRAATVVSADSDSIFSVRAEATSSVTSVTSNSVPSGNTPLGALTAMVTPLIVMSFLNSGCSRVSIMLTSTTCSS